MAVITLILAAFSARSLAQGLELSFCAPVAAWPMSQRDRPGFDNAIAEILADELGAVATFRWITFDDIGIRDNLHAGLCDIAIGIGEGAAGMLSTVPYLTAPYVFVTRTDRDLEVGSLDDPDLAQLRIGTYQAGIPSVSLRNRGMVDNVREYPATITPTGVDNHSPILDAVLSGEVDVGIVYGPIAGYRALQEGGVLTIRPVTPEIDIGTSILQLSRTWTIGVRPFDEALRDRLNRALAARWDEVDAVLEAYGVPRLPISRPTVTETLPDAARVGVIYPARTPASLSNAAEGESARLGTLVAENAIALAGPDSALVVVLKANAPTLEAVERAALRLVLVEEVDVLVGGYTNEEARLLAGIAAQHGVAYFNVGAESPDLRAPACYPTTLHVAPSAATLVEASFRALDLTDAQGLFAVSEAGLDADLLSAAIGLSAAGHGLPLLGEERVQSDQFIFFPVFDTMLASGADVLLLLMDSELQERLLSQASALPAHVRVIGLDPVRGQSRAYLQRYTQVAPGIAAQPRVVVWDPALPTDLNFRFVTRTSEPMEAAAWTTYAAVLSAFSAARAGVLHDTDRLLAFLLDEATSLDLGKLSPVRFHADDRQLVQELYLVEPVPGAEWGRTAAARIALAGVSEVIDMAAADGSPLPAEHPCDRP